MFIKNRKKLNKRGFTLVELTVVMAISAIISVMIVTTATLISAQVKKNGLRADFMQAVVDFRSDLQIQFAEVDNGGEIDSNELSYDLKKYEYIDDITFDKQGDILKVVVSNSKLGESQSFILISKVG